MNKNIKVITVYDIMKFYPEKKIEDITPGDIKKLYPYKKTNHFSEYLEATKPLYDDNTYKILHKRIFDLKNEERVIYFYDLISKIKYISDEHFYVFEKILVKILKRTNLYDIKKDIVELIERFVGKELSLHKSNFENMKKMFNQCEPKKTQEMSKDGKYILIYFTVKDLEGNIVSSYYMNYSGRKNGLSDQYKIFKMKQIAEKNPEYKEIAENLETLFSLDSLNKKNHKQYNNLTEYEKEFDKCKEIAKDLGWI